MQPALSLLVTILVAVCSARAEDLATLPIDARDAALTHITFDAAVSSDGNGSLRIESPHGFRACVGEVANLDVKAGTIHYTARVKTAGVTAGAYLEMWCETQEGKRSFSRGFDQIVKGDTDWSTVSIPMHVSAPYVVSKVILNVVNEGPGAVWVDDVKLEKR